jgi:hypothetical protein
MDKKSKKAASTHLQAATGTLVTLLTAAHLSSSYIVVTAWCKYAPDWDDTLESLWNKTGSSDWKPTPAGTGTPATAGVGSATLAQMLSDQNHGRYTATIDQQFILKLSPNTVRGLSAALTW